MIRSHRYAAANKTNPRVFALRFSILQRAVLLHDSHWAHRRREWVSGGIGDVVPGIRSTHYLPFVWDRPGDIGMELAAGTVCEMGVCHSRPLCASCISRGMDSDSRIVRIRCIRRAVGNGFRISKLAARDSNVFGDTGLRRTGSDQQHGTSFRRGDRLAGISSSPLGAAGGLHLGLLPQRMQW